MEENLNMQMAEPRKKNKKSIIIICIVVGIVLIGLSVFLIMHLNSYKNKIPGVWKREIEQSDSDTSLYSFDNIYWEFTSDNYLYYDFKYKTYYYEDSDPHKKFEINDDILSIISYYKLASGEYDSYVSIKYRITKLTNNEMELQVLDSPTDIIRFTKIETNKIEKEKENQKFIATNSNAYRIYIYLVGATADYGYDKYSTNGVVSIESLKDSDNALAQEVYKACRDMDTGGYCYIKYDSSDYDGNFVQWSESESGTIVGQYPNPPKSYDEAAKITLGKKA